MNRRRAPYILAILWMLCCPPSASATDTRDSLRTVPHGRLIITADEDSARVSIDGYPVGLTPLTLDTLSPGSHTVVVESRLGESWYRRADSLAVSLGSGQTREFRFTVRTPLRFEPYGLAGVSPLLREKNGLTPKKIAIFASGSVAIVAGVTAAYCKIAADGRQSTYLQTGDPSLLSQRRRLDTMAGIALGITQLGFIVLSYLLLTE